MDEMNPITDGIHGLRRHIYRLWRVLTRPLATLSPLTAGRGATNFHSREEVSSAAFLLTFTLAKR